MFSRSIGSDTLCFSLIIHHIPTPKPRPRNFTLPLKKDVTSHFGNRCFDLTAWCWWQSVCLVFLRWRGENCLESSDSLCPVSENKLARLVNCSRRLPWLKEKSTAAHMLPGVSWLFRSCYSTWQCHRRSLGHVTELRHESCFWGALLEREKTSMEARGWRLWEVSLSLSEP